MPAATLEKQDVKTIFQRYIDQGKPRPGLLKTLDEVGSLKGLDRKVGSIPRLKKLIDEIDMEEINARFDLKKPLPDPITALASKLYNQLYEDFETVEARIRSEYTDDLAALTQQIETLHETIDNQQQTIDEWQKENLDLQAQVDAAHQTITHQRDQLDETNEALAQKDILLANAKDTVAATKSLLVARESEFATQISHANEKIDDLTTKLQQNETSHKKALVEKDKHIDDLKNDIVGRQAYILQLDSKVRQSESRINELNAQLGDKDKAIVTLQQNVRMLHDEKQTDQTNLLQLQMQLTQKSDEILQLNKTVFEHELKTTELRSELGKLKKEISQSKITKTTE